MKHWHGMWAQRSMVIETDGGFWLVLGLMGLLFPLRILAAIALAASIHELGHILLGHVGQYPLVNREPQTTDNPIEQAANVFAARLLAPACVLWGCRVQSAADIERLCHVSRQAAEYRMERMRLRYARDRFLTSPLEGAVYRQFEEYIKTHRVNRCSPAAAPPSDE